MNQGCHKKLHGYKNQPTLDHSDESFASGVK